MNNRAWRHIQLNVVIEYNVSVKDHHVRDDCNIESSNDHYSFVTKTENDP